MFSPDDFMDPLPGDILTESQILIDLRATDRWEAIDELIDHLIKIGKVKSKHREVLIAAVGKRDSAMSTGIGFGVGIPHASTSCVHETVAALGRSKRSINFDAPDRQPVSLVVLFLVPPGQLQNHLHTMTEFAKLLQKPEIHRALIQAPDAGAILQIIGRQPASGLTPDEHG
jgi:mannitol/fructose-specific phosphotransferase system IIA component (Ntr-type)